MTDLHPDLEPPRGASFDYLEDSIEQDTLQHRFPSFFEGDKQASFTFGIQWKKMVDEKTNTIRSASSETAGIGDTILYAIGSMTKLLLVVCLFRIIEEQDQLHGHIHNLYSLPGDSWDQGAFQTLNALRGKRGPSTVLQPNRLPSIRRVLMHYNALPPMQQWLFGPDGQFLTTIEGFLDTAYKVIDYLDSEEPQGFRYSNANYILIAAIIEAATGMELHEALQKIVLDEVGMENTVLTRQEFDDALKAGRVAKPHLIGPYPRIVEPPCYLSDAAALASGGCYSCTRDMQKLLRYIMERLDDIERYPRWQEVFGVNLDVGADHTDLFTMCGLGTDLDSATTGSQSLERVMHPQSYRLGTQEREHIFAIFKAGAVTGYSSHYCLIPQRRVFLAVLTNSSGAADSSYHLTQYLLQQIFSLSPPVEFAKEIPPLEQAIARSFTQSCFSDEGGHSIVEAEVNNLTGTFTSNPAALKVVIANHGQGLELALSGSAVDCTVRMTLVRWGKDIFYAVLPREQYGIDRFDAWKDMAIRVTRGKAAVVSAFEFRLHGRVNTKGIVFERLNSV